MFVTALRNLFYGLSQWPSGKHRIHMYMTNIDKSRKNAEVFINEEKIEKHKKYKWNQQNAVSYSTDTFNK